MVKPSSGVPKGLYPLKKILQETVVLIKIFVTSIKTAEKTEIAVECSVLGVCFSFDVGRSMFDVHLSK